MSERELSDGQLAKLLVDRHANEAAFVEAYRRFMPKMIVRAGRVLGDLAGYSEDVAQETLAKILLRGSLERLQDPAGITSYLLVATERAAVDLLRAVGRETPTDSVQAKTVWIDSASDSAALRQALEEVLRALRPEQQEIIRWRFLEELSLSEIATRSKIGYAAAGQRLSRAIARAREVASTRSRK